MEIDSLIAWQGMKVSDIPEISALLPSIAKVASWLHAQGWAEANAGNLSLRVGKAVRKHFQSLGIELRFSEAYLVSRTGSRYREMADNPAEGLLLVFTNFEEEFYLPANAKPTSEWKCHRLLHEADVQAQYPCILHSHPTDIIALSHTQIYADEAALNKHLSGLLPELSIYLPKGIATSPYAKPGSKVLADLSNNCFADRQVLIWQGHGLVCRAIDIAAALDLTEIVNKGAKLHFILHK